MKQDPYSQLSGLDQRLFQEERTKETRKQANKLPSLEARKPPTNPPTLETSVKAGNASRKPESNQATKPPFIQSSNERRQEARRTGASSLRGQKPAPRISERHTYDIYQDQVRWMNRVKLDMEELYDKRVTINGAIQLAIDILREDYDQNGARSQLIRVLVKGHALSLKPSEVREGETEG